jgi:acetyl esterase/lipase
MIHKEGSEVAKWLDAIGIACFMLKYRLAPCPADDEEFRLLAESVGDRAAAIKKYSRLAMEDGKQAIRVLRRKSAELGIDSDRVGILGFSAGGIVAGSAAMSKSADCRPNYAGVVYGAPRKIGKISKQGPPLFIAYAGDDDVVANGGLNLFAGWRQAGLRVEMHIYSRGGHGFGMQKQGLASDKWIDQFGQWLKSEGIVK